MERRTFLRGSLLSTAGVSSQMTGGTLAGWFDLLVHRQQVSPVHGI
ncbi:hypothetical protein EV644_101632 [Kribbella orskensis]|uniref:Twin-arginine translocation signal domain-containing protein n=1 Tax=Kribbella orskensis TaxID=2512216 RepID=A0ABY2BWX4_9ACTN|nr:hypothetical protein EV642_101357 [Kribbella sp. VKM Ac-2500]TCO31989.1 hypothetical protein EV644_101632 [Kribbella orskensis]